MSKNITAMKGNEIAIHCLERLGIDLVFAYPGGTAIELHQALSKSEIRVVLPRHEQGGAFAAAGYARATGKVGVAMATSGPGATNLITGIADAYLDSIPTIFITGQVASNLIGKNVFQETDMIGMTRPIVKHSYLILDANQIIPVFKEAYSLALSGRPGPIVIDIPKNIQQQLIEIDFEAEFAKAGEDEDNCEYAPTNDEIEKIKELIADAKAPCVYAGGGIISAEATDDLRKFVESYNLPITTTLMGVGIIPDSHELSLSWLGMHGTVYANNAANEADLLLCFGARFDDRVTGNPANFAKHAKIIHVDIDDSEINKNKFADLGIVADIKKTLQKLNEKPLRQDYSEWFAKIANWKKEFPKSFKKKAGHIQPQYVMELLSKLTNDDAIIVPGVGQHQMWAAQYYKYNFPRQLITSGGLGSMGFGLPSAMGVKAARPDKLVINIDGDGSFQMNIQELGTLKVEELDVKMVILNNQHLGMVAQWEDRFYNSNRGNTVLGNCKGSNGYGNCETCTKSCKDLAPYPNFVKIAEGYGIKGLYVDKLEDLEAAIKTMVETDGPFLLDVNTGYEEHVLPMIPPGKDYKSIITE